MTDLNGAPPDAPTPQPRSMSGNLKAGVTGPNKIKALVGLGFIVLLVAFVAIVRNDKKEEPTTAEKSQVAVSEVELEDDEKGAAASNPEVDQLIAEAEAERQKSAIEEGSTYVPPVPDLDSTPAEPVRSEESQPKYVHATVSAASQQAKLAALQGLDSRMSETKYAVVSEVKFERPAASTTTTAAATAPTSADGSPAAATSTADALPVKKAYPAGTVWFATTQVAIDSDVPGPIKARIEQGPFAGGEALGSYEVTGRKYVTMSFSKIVHEGVEYPIDAIGLNPNNGIAGIEGDVNNHWGQRLILPTLASAVAKYAEAATFGGVTSITSAGSIVQQPELSDSEKLQYALGEGVNEGITPVIQDEAKAVKRTVTLPQSTSFGLMLTTGL